MDLSIEIQKIIELFAYFYKVAGVLKVDSRDRSLFKVDPRGRSLFKVDPRDRSLVRVDPRGWSLFKVDPRDRSLFKVDPRGQSLFKVDPRDRSLFKERRHHIYNDRETVMKSQHLIVMTVTKIRPLRRRS